MKTRKIILAVATLLAVSLMAAGTAKPPGSLNCWPLARGTSDPQWARDSV